MRNERYQPKGKRDDDGKKMALDECMGSGVCDDWDDDGSSSGTCGVRCDDTGQLEAGTRGNIAGYWV